MGKMILIMILTVIMNSKSASLGVMLLLVCLFSFAHLVYIMPFKKVPKKCMKGEFQNILMIVCELILLLYLAMIMIYDETSPSIMAMLGICQALFATLFAVSSMVLGTISSYTVMVNQNYEIKEKVYLKTADKEEAKIAKKRLANGDFEDIENNEDQEIEDEDEENEHESEGEDEAEGEHDEENEQNNEEIFKEKSKRTKAHIDYATRENK